MSSIHAGDRRRHLALCFGTERAKMEITSRCREGRIDAQLPTHVVERARHVRPRVPIAREVARHGQAALGAAQANLAAARQDQQRLAAERSGIHQQRANVRLRAPIDGVVVARDAEPGSTVVAGQAVLRLIEPSSLWVKVRLDQARSSGLAVGLPAQIVLRSNAGRTLAGKVARVEAVSDSVTEERIAQVAFDQAPAALSVGELAEVSLTLPATAKAVTLPNAAIKRQQGRSGVWTIADERLHFTPVRVGQASLDGQVQVLEGLASGSTVVLHSEKELAATSRIRVVESLAGQRP